MEQMFDLGSYILGVVVALTTHHICIKIKERHEKNKVKQEDVSTSYHQEESKVDNFVIDKANQRSEDVRVQLVIERVAEKYVKNNNYKKPTGFRIVPSEIINTQYTIFNKGVAKFAAQPLTKYFWDEVVKLEKIYETDK